MEPGNWGSCPDPATGNPVEAYVVTAAEFVADLYAELVQGRSLGQAATLARKGLADDPLRTIAYDPVPLEDWPVPVPGG